MEGRAILSVCCTAQVFLFDLILGKRKPSIIFFFSGVGIASISRSEDSKRDLVELYTITWCFGDYSQIHLNYVF